MKKFENQLFFRKENTIAIAPGFTLSEGVMRNEVQLKHFREISAKARTLVRDEKPEDLVGAAIFSSTPSFNTSQTLVVDGGAYFH